MTIISNQSNDLRSEITLKNYVHALFTYRDLLRAEREQTTDAASALDTGALENTDGKLSTGKTRNGVQEIDLEHERVKLRRKIFQFISSQFEEHEDAARETLVAMGKLEQFDYESNLHGKTRREIDDYLSQLAHDAHVS